MKTALIILCAALIAMAQSPAAPPMITTGPDAPSPSGCAPTTVGTIYVRSEPIANGPVQVLRCTQTGYAAYAWHPISHYVGASLPGKCAIGDFAFKTDAVAGQNVYGCSAADTWTSNSADGGGPVIATTGVFTGVVSTPGVTYTPVTVLAPPTTVAGRVFRYTHDSATGACSGTGTAVSLCYSDGTNWNGLTGTGLGVPGGSSGQVQYNSGGNFAGDSGLAYNSSTKALGVIGPVTVGQTGTATGAVKFNGTTSGTLTLQPNDAATDSTLTLPGLTGTLAVGPGVYVTGSDPGCTVAGNIGKLWFNTTTNTTALSACTSVSGTVGWASITIP